MKDKEFINLALVNIDTGQIYERNKAEIGENFCILIDHKNVGQMKWFYRLLAELKSNMTDQEWCFYSDLAKLASKKDYSLRPYGKDTNRPYSSYKELARSLPWCDEETCKEMLEALSEKGYIFIERQDPYIEDKVIFYFNPFVCLKQTFF